MPDLYSNFTHLNQRERIGVDFRIYLREGAESVAFIAPHGGKIERGTSEIAAAIAGNIYGIYCFEGLKSRENKKLHITSSNFDEPLCLDFVTRYDQIISVHGCRGNDMRIFLGGQDEYLRDMIRVHLDAVGIAAGSHLDSSLQGIDPNNICNKGRQKRGVQLEITKGFRTFLISRKGDQTLSKLVSAIRSATHEAEDR